MRAKKGPVIDTAIIAGTLAVKRTHELIPFCHPLAIERCDLAIDFIAANELPIRCDVAVSHKTGVEMEALTGAVDRGADVYDMCKALSHEIVIADVRLSRSPAASGASARARSCCEHTHFILRLDARPGRKG